MAQTNAERQKKYQDKKKAKDFTRVEFFVEKKFKVWLREVVKKLLEDKRNES